MSRKILAALAFVATAGCASVAPDAGVREVNELASARIRQPVPEAAVTGDRQAIDARVAERLSHPLAADDAVAIALLNNPGLQDAYAELGIARADLARAGLPPNPGFSFARFRRGESVEIERKLLLDIVELIAMPWRLQAERASFSAAQVRVARQVVALADEARRAWVEAVAAGEDAAYALRVRDAAQASAELAREMARKGNFNKLTQSREEAFLAEAETGLARAEHATRAARERLGRAMGIEAPTRRFTLPERLPDPPEQAATIANAETRALSERLDVRAARAGAQATARSLSLARATRFAGVRELTLERDTASGEPARRGYEVEIELPIFDGGAGRIRRAEAVQRQAEARLTALETRARSEVRESHSAYTAAHDIARRYRTEIVPLRQRISEENLLRYNGMLISVFELLADAREQAAAVRGAIAATRDFWLADANLAMAITTGSPAAFELAPAAASSATAMEAH